MERTIEVLNQLEREGVFRRYAIGGAVAVLFYAEPILTYDLDVFVLLASEGSSGLVDLSPIYQRLAELGHHPDREAVIVVGVPVQVIPAYNPLVEDAVALAEEVRFGGATARVVGYEHLLAIMAQTGRPKDRERLASLLDQRPPDTARLDAILRRHALVETWQALTG
jgi:predicted nucleotidyltransferase